MVGLNKMLSNKDLRILLHTLKRADELADDSSSNYIREMMKHEYQKYEVQKRIDPNSPEGIAALIRRALEQYMTPPLELCMSAYTWTEFISPETKEYIVELLDIGMLFVRMDNGCSDKQMYICMYHRSGNEIPNSF